LLDKNELVDNQFFMPLCYADAIIYFHERDFMHEKAFWQSILENKGAIPDDVSLDELTEELLEFLRSPEPELRDNFGYQILAHWIVSGHYDNEKLEQFLRRWLDDLQTGLGEQNTDSVLVRSFAALMLSILVYRDIQESWLSEADYQRLFDSVLDYFQAEQDLRGYDAQKGWIHATAHTADILKFLARNSKTDADGLEKILAVIVAKVTYPQAVIFTHNEDERIALIVLDVLKRENLSRKSLKAWLGKFTGLENGMTGTELEPTIFGAYQNTKHFLQALFFKLSFNKDIPDANELEYAIYEMLKEF
jgi:uncharacterized protein DUF2785